MSRTMVAVRDAVAADVPALAELWHEVLRRAPRADQEEDLRAVLERVAAREDERLVVAEYDGRLAGATLLRATTMSAINLDAVVQIVSPHVVPEFQRRGVGAVLMEAGATFAEEHGVGLVATAALSASRDSNRFFARLGLGPQAVLRVAATLTLRQRLTSLRPASSRAAHASHRHIDRVLAARRIRRAERV